VEDYEQQAYEEGRYWFCLTDVVDYMEIVGKEKVFDDLSDLFNQRQKFDQKRVSKVNLDDIPF
jgi:prophage antirepressor-like protein